MRLSGRTRRIVFGFMLASGIALTLPYLAFGAAHSFGNVGRFRAPGMHREHSSSRHLHRIEVFDEGGLDGQQVVIIQQFQSQATGGPGKPTDNGIYVPPHWVDGGYGVQVSKPGYWIDPKQAAEH